MTNMNILLVDDSPGDIRLAQEALREHTLVSELHVVTDGMQALDFLYRRGVFENAVTPSIILLDINLPKKNGMEVLREIKNDERLSAIPVIVLSTSQSEHDVRCCYQLHANCFIVKPVDFHEFSRVVHGIVDFWMKCVMLAHRPEGDTDKHTRTV